MELRDILRVVWKRLWLIVLGTLLVTVVAYAVSKNKAPVYQAKVTMMVNQSTDTPRALSSLLSTGESLALTYSKLLKARPLLETVIANLNLELSPEYLKEKMLGTSLIQGAQLLELTIKDTDPQRAAGIANELAYTFISLHNSERQLESIVELEEDVMAQMADLRVRIKQNQSEMGKISITSDPLAEKDLSIAHSTLATQQLTFANLLETFLKIRLAQAELLDVSVVEPAVVPVRPIGRGAAFYALLGAVVGLSLNGGLVMLLEYLTRSFETGDDVKQVLDLPTLGTIPRRRGAERKSRLVTVALPHAAVSEAYRGLRTSIRYSSVDRPLKTLLITSAETGAGKTSVSANLGVVCAQAGLRVALVDADLRSPQLHRPFDLENRTGLTDLLVGDVPQASDCMLETGVDGLRLIASGPIPPNPSELLGSRRMEGVLAQLSEDADLVILDAPPALPVTDAAVMAARADGAILVVEAKRTSHDDARQARETLERVGGNILGVALTKVKTGRRGYYYYNAESKPSRGRIWKVWNRLANARET